MSSGVRCECSVASEAIAEKRWVVVQRNCNHSAFNGYRQTPSDYSGIRCLRCGTFWRTKAQYVRRLSDAKPGEETMPVNPPNF